MTANTVPARKDRIPAVPVHQQFSTSQSPGQLVLAVVVREVLDGGEQGLGRVASIGRRYQRRVTDR